MTEKVIQLRPSSYGEKLGNYIKELEEENKELKEEYITLEKDYGTCELENGKLGDKIKELEEENKIVHKDFNELSEKYFFEKSRIDKATEYIEETKCVFGTNLDMHYLLKILKGEE